ncbi:chorismate mutase [Ochrobactrum soli]|uniref:chorismate mutase n=1 Tax=Brucella/Ochrobactrum group TaxID=2826938 RepID=UPI000EF22C91|nr:MULTISPECIES: chorismate mutase [Brucella]RLL64616.1 chorismate mutase [[Ochrobactrum] soli]WHS30051.1 chorismate mutase [Brucella sp. NM4]WHT44466.1 chorismate mutase [Ochrobactrum sp. SSR]
MTHDAAEQFASYRKSIDNLDSALLNILAERFRCTEQVGHLKAEQAMPAIDSERERRQMDRLKSIANDVGLSQHFVEGLMRMIVRAVVERHKEIAASK